jgi:hypothetical protein
MRQKCAIVALTLLALSAASAASASAQTLFVSNTVPTVPVGKSCSQPGFKSVQSAIAAATAGATVDVCNGTYTEQLEIEKAIRLTAVNGAGTATIAMPATGFALSTSSCDTSGGLQQWDEISICTPEKVSITNLNVEAEAQVETCANGLYGIFVAGGGTLTATGDTIVGASTTNNTYFGCQHGVAVEVGVKTPAEVGHAILKSDKISGYEKNGPTVKSAGSTLTISASTITGVGPSPYIAQNGVEVAFGAKGTITGSTVGGNECNVGSCGARGEQASGVLFYQAAAGSKVSSSSIEANDLGAYYASGSSTVPATPQVSLVNDVFTANRYEAVELEEGKASLSKDTIAGPGRVGIDLFQASYQESASESKAVETKIEGQSEAAILVESDKSPSDPAGKFSFTKGTATGNGTVLINESNNFEVIL